MEVDAERFAAVRDAAVFAGLDDAETEAIAALLRPFSAAVGETLFRAGAPVERLLLLRAGSVRLDDLAGGTARPGDALGELALNGPTTHSATGNALEPVHGFELEIGDFDELRAARDPVAFAVLRRLGRVLAERIRAAGDAEPAPGDGKALTSEATPGPPAIEEMAVLRRLPCFAEFDQHELAELARTLSLWRLDRGATLFSEGEAARSAFVVVRGAIEVTRVRGDRRLRLATVGPGRLLGELSLVDGGPRSATCRAADRALVLELEQEVVVKLLDERSGAGLGFLQALNRNLIAALQATDARRSRMGADWPTAPDRHVDRQRLVEQVRASVIGDDAVLDGPFGGRRIVYADYTASGRALAFIERFIQDEVLPLYANTHTEASATGLQTTRLREDARRIVHRAVGGADEDVVLFCGTGATGAIDKLVQVLGLRVPTELDDRFGLGDAIPAEERPVVFVGPYEHHSNELPWRESIADVVTIREDADGRVDLGHLEHELLRFADRPLKIGSFSAASNVTGIVTDADQLAILLHRHGALSCWDYAAAGPYLPIDMNPSPEIPDGHLAYKDAVFLSPHKFVGGPGTPGILVAKRSLFRNRVPAVPGGGTITFVSPTEHAYHPDPVIREEGGTPPIVGSIRAGLAFALKEAVGTEEIRKREDDFVGRALESWGASPQIEILGNPALERLAIVSLGLRHPRGLLHSNFVVAVLNDLFGIQARSGCFCAGPYVHRMYPVDDDWSERMAAEAMLGHLGAKLSFVRVNFNYFISETVFEYILEAVHLLANDGWKLLPLYRFDPYSGLWHHESGRPRPPLTLHDVSFASGTMEFRGPRATEPESALARYLEEARRIVREVESAPVHGPLRDPTVTPEFERIRWFPLPGEALAELRDAQKRA
jgi:selenocysteine lyase/cysteine desulfurase/CRP-like cAMP-binding protein